MCFLFLNFLSSTSHCFLFLFLFTLVFLSSHCLKLDFYKTKFPRAFSACHRSIICLAIPIYVKKLKSTQDFGPNPIISPIGKKFQQIGLKYQQIQVNGWNMAQNVSSRHRKFFNWSRGLEDIRQKADFESEHTLAHSCCIMKKVGYKGILWCYIGESWRKLAQVG